MKEIVLSYEKVQEHLKNKPEDKNKILKHLDEIKGDYSSNVLSTMESFIDKTFVKLYDGFNVEMPEGFSLEETLKSHHVIFCPNHQSHADYLALQYIFFKRFKIPVYIAAGINLNIFPIGKIFKKCGAFFIRRKFTEYTYKIAFQGYIYYLLKTDKVVEFFFEGGRTRTGKLLAPKFGLFSMILDAHTKFDGDKKPLIFIPISIAHEHIPEEGAHAKELGGAKKEKEKPTQLLGLYKLFTKKLGTVHVKFGEGTVVDEEITDLKAKTQELAFDTFRKVGQGMPITPTALLSLIFLDEPSGILTWKQVEINAKEVLDYCDFMDIPITKSLKGDQGVKSIRLAMDLFINNKKIDVIKKEKLNKVFYSIKPESRVNFLYHKNMILHHFFVPTIMNATWFNIFNGTIKTQVDLSKFLLVKRKELKYEFYLPETTKMIEEGMKIIEFALGRKLENIGDILNLSSDDLYLVANKVRRFTTVLNHIYEAYYITMITVRYLEDKPFSQEQFLQTSLELYKMEKEHGRVVKYEESYTVPKMKSSLNYLQNLKVIQKNEDNAFEITDHEKVNVLINKFAKDVNDQVSINLKFNNI